MTQANAKTGSLSWLPFNAAAAPDTWISAQEAVVLRRVNLDTPASQAGIFNANGGTDTDKALELADRILGDGQPDFSRQRGESLAAQCRDGLAGPAPTMRQLRLRGKSGATFAVTGGLWS